MKHVELLRLAVLIMIGAGIYTAFSSAGIAESGYAELLGSASFLTALGDAAAIKAAMLIMTIITTIILYLSLKKAFEDEAVAFLIAVLFLFSPLISFGIAFLPSPSSLIAVFLFAIALAIFVFVPAAFRAFSVLPFLAALFLLLPILSPAFSLRAVTSVGFVLPLAFLLFVFRELRKKELAVPCAISVILSPFLPELSIVALSFYAVLGVMHFLKNPHMIEGWLTLSFFIIIFVNAGAQNSLAPLMAATIVTVILYFLFTLYSTSLRAFSSLFPLFIVALAATDALLFFQSDPLDVPSPELIAAFQFAGKEQLDVGILDFQSSYRFHSGMSGKSISSEQLLSKEELPVDYLLLSSSGLLKIFENRSVALKPLGFMRNEQGQLIGMFGNKRFILYVALSADLNEVLPQPQPVLLDLQYGYKKNIPFTKLRRFSPSLPLMHKDNLLINLDGITDSSLYRTLLKGKELFSGNSTKIMWVG